MNIFSFLRHYSQPTLFLLALSLALIGFSFNSVVAAQETSREEMIKEAGRLGTEAERMRGEAYQQARAGGNRKLIWEAERAAAEKFKQALELWRTVGETARIVTVAEEISRIYSVLNDYENAIGGLRREVEFWHERKDLNREINTTWLIGIRQMQMGRSEEAIKTLEEVVETSHAANLGSLEANTLETLASLYEKAGRTAEAVQLKARGKGIWEQLYSNMQPEVKQQRQPVKLPVQWLDLPSSPLVAEYRDVEGVRSAVLVNRSTQGIENVAFGCVAEQDGKVRVVGQLGGMGLNHGGVRPGYYYEAFGYLNGPLNQWTNEKMGCEGKAKMAVVNVTYADRTEWKAEGTNWTGH